MQDSLPSGRCPETQAHLSKMDILLAPDTHVILLFILVINATTIGVDRSQNDCFLRTNNGVVQDTSHSGQTGSSWQDGYLRV